MPKISVQFHALPEEIFDYVKVWSKEFGLFIVIIELNPSFTVKLIADEEYENNELCNSRRICLYLKNPDLNQRSYLEFLNKNPDCLSVSIGKYSENKLEESIIGTQTQNAESLKIWKKLLRNSMLLLYLVHGLLILIIKQKHFIKSIDTLKVQKNYSKKE